MASISKRSFLKYLTGGIAGVGATLAAIPFFKYFAPNKYTLKDITWDVDISKLQPGQIMSVNWAHRPIYILKRTEDMLKHLENEHSYLADPSSDVSVQPIETKNNFRSINPEVLVVTNICTHLGCSVAYNPPGMLTVEALGKRFKHGGFHCPCHGASYDVAGRVFKNMPAPKNLEVPHHEFVDENTIRFFDPKYM